ncbi:MAG: pyrroloquinoline quinone biosynthesis protein PqqE, partial [Saccharothrix sp.]|nr:pyrroloquinoline quinone biosynthesis protein PqqE [Saccharothrix sp.]
SIDHVQLSVQDADPASADRIAGVRGFAHKLRAARVVKDAGLPLTVNVVLHRQNLDRVAEIVRLAEDMGADRLELANTQYYGWALRNQAALLPTREQLRRADEVVREAKGRSPVEIVYVIADYHEAHPKPCMHGWGARQLTVAPDGDVLPCPAASVIEGLGMENVRSRPLREIWHDSVSFNAFRGYDWMGEPCRSCARREVDFGGCRCQAFQLTGNAANTDPVCSLSPHRGLVDLALRQPVGSSVPREVAR